MDAELLGHLAKIAVFLFVVLLGLPAFIYLGVKYILWLLKLFESWDKRLGRK